LNQIFSGAVTNWKAVGGADAPITVYARDDKSGTYDTFKSLVLKKDQALVASAERFESSEALRKMVAADTHGIGFVGLTFVQQVTALAISSGAAYVSPTAFSIATEEYPLARRLYYYTPATPENELTRDFIEFALSQEGQQLVNETGFVGQNLQVASSRKSAQRLNVSFRFTSGSANLDNKAQRDLERLARMMQQPENARRALLLYGYCDNQGNPQANQFLSQQRAQAVARLLKQRGLTPAYVKGYGAANPIASNATSEGRERNRRVDVWLK
jgi:phosphate transport system substrate-binding protein